MSPAQRIIDAAPRVMAYLETMPDGANSLQIGHQCGLDQFVVRGALGYLLALAKVIDTSDGGPTYRWTRVG